jgi:DNA-binding NtrC family response regulator
MGNNGQPCQSVPQSQDVANILALEYTPRRVLVVEDNDLTARQLQRLLGQDVRLQVDAVSDGVQALARLAERSHSLVITDLRMPQMDGMELIAEIQRRRLPVTVIVLTGAGSVQEAVQAMHHGVYHFLTKPLDLELLRLVVKRALQDRALQDELAYLREQMQTHYRFHNVLTRNPKLQAVIDLVGHLAHTNTTVLIQGETGTGKEQVARAIHQASERRDGPFVAVNCAGLPETLLESELFGHEKGAFTGAIGQRKGRFELAQGGTLFLDEIGDSPATMQAKLLRVLQERCFERIGASTSIEVDVRIIAATNRSLTRLVRKGSFRQDLYYRLNVVKMDLPPLRERKEDIPLLATHFAQIYTPSGDTPRRFSPEAMEVLLNFDWPGNVRQLANAIERACVISREGLIQVDNLPPELVAAPTEKSGISIDLNRPLPELINEVVTSLERQYISKALRKSRGNVGRCARICGLSRRSITTKISQYAIDRSAWKGTSPADEEPPDNTPDTV